MRNCGSSSFQTMKRNTEIRLYNVLFPVWILVFFPSWLWLILIPGNYLIDRTVLYFSLKEGERNAFCRKHSWKICLAGFSADFVGALFLFAVSLAATMIQPVNNDYANYLLMNHFRSFPALVTVIAAIALSGVLIFLLDRKILEKAGLSGEAAHHSALVLALVTAPYLFLIPASLIYV